MGASGRGSVAEMVPPSHLRTSLGKKMPSLARLILHNPRNIGFIHFVRIPLSTAILRPQLDKAHERVSSDPVAASLPRGAFLLPSRLHVNIGELNLDNPQRIDAAIKFIHSLDMEAMLKETTPELGNKKFDNAILSRHPGLHVDIRGLHIRGSRLSLHDRRDLWASVIDT